MTRAFSLDHKVIPDLHSYFVAVQIITAICASMATKSAIVAHVSAIVHRAVDMAHRDITSVF